MAPEIAGDWINAMAVSVELVASRWAEGLAAPELRRMADHQSHAGLARGPWQPCAAHDWTAQTREAQINGRTPVTRTGSHSLNDPTWLLPAWLQRLAHHGSPAAAGTAVTTGSWVGCLPVQPGDLVSVDFAGLRDLTVRLLLDSRWAAACLPQHARSAISCRPIF